MSGRFWGWVELLFRHGIPTKKETERALAQQYMSGFNEGYEAATHDFFHAETKDGKYDQDWMNNTPSLHRKRGALKRWYKVI